MLPLSEALSRAHTEDIPRRRRSARAINNDAKLRAAAVDLIADSGWDALTFTTLASHAGLTVGAVYGRAENKAELGADLWTSTVGQPFTEAMTQLVDASTPSVKSLSQWDEAPALLIAGCELLIAAMFDEDLAEVIYDDMADSLRTTLGSAQNATKEAVRTLIVAEVIGRLLCIMGGEKPRQRSRRVVSRQRRLLSETIKTRKTRTSKADQPEWVVANETGDPHRDVLELAALESLGRVGYRRATVARICRMGALSSGSMFARFDSKDHLISSAYAAHLRPLGSLANSARSPHHLVADYLSEDNNVLRSLWLELVRVHAHNEAVDIDVPNDHLGQLLLGLGLLCHYRPEICTLPFAAVLDLFAA
jgi:AcrR family transcriptional regulator